MTEVNNQGQVQGGGIGLTSKVGPLPVYVWGLLGLGLVLAYSWYKNKNSSSATDTTATTPSPSDQTPPFIIQNYPPMAFTNSTVPPAARRDRDKDKDEKDNDDKKKKMKDVEYQRVVAPGTMSLQHLATKYHTNPGQIYELSLKHLDKQNLLQFKKWWAFHEDPKSGNTPVPKGLVFYVPKK